MSSDGAPADAVEADGRLQLAQLPRPERAAALAAMVVAEFRTVLQMMPHEVLPGDESFFDLGLTSLSVEEVKQRLESRLACRVDAEVLFNHPTLGHLLAHLQGGPLSEL
ncbi:MAG TPA: acyl carrier protein, partial [Ideonella sp.]|nr:acyl carrier protein [Ideonella sp.]